VPTNVRLCGNGMVWCYVYRELEVHLRGGTAFVQCLVNPPKVCIARFFNIQNLILWTAVCRVKKSTYFLSLKFGRMRYRSEQFPCCVDPQFSGKFSFDLQDYTAWSSHTSLFQFHVAVTGNRHSMV